MSNNIIPKDDKLYDGLMAAWRILCREMGYTRPGIALDQYEAMEWFEGKFKTNSPVVDKHYNPSSQHRVEYNGYYYIFAV